LVPDIVELPILVGEFGVAAVPKVDVILSSFHTNVVWRRRTGGERGGQKRHGSGFQFEPGHCAASAMFRGRILRRHERKFPILLALV
jgi:hypothetical protein